MLKLLFFLLPTTLLAADFNCPQGTTLDVSEKLGIKSSFCIDEKTNKKHGPFVKKYSNGKLNSKGTFFQGNLDGNIVMFHPNGKISSQQFYENGVREGTYMYYYVNGQMMEKGKRKKDKKEGPVTVWDHTGKKIGTLTKKAGKTLESTVPENFFDEQKKIFESKCQVTMVMIWTALEAYKEKNKVYPKSLKEVDLPLNYPKDFFDIGTRKVQVGIGTYGAYFPSNAKLTQDSFTIACVGNIDSDTNLLVVTMNHKKEFKTIAED
jgi:hypothetical protein